MKKVYSAVAVTVLVFILFSAIVFLAPIPLTALFWLSYVFTVVAIFAQLGFSYIAFHSGVSARSRFYGFPIFRIGILYLIIQLILGFLLMLLGRVMPLWLGFLLQLAVMALAAIGLIAADNTRDHVQFVEKKQESNTVAIQTMRADMQALAKRYPELESLAESFRYADPVTIPQTDDIERELYRLIGEFSACPDEAARIRLRNRVQEMLDQRNAICLAGKTR